MKKISKVQGAYVYELTVKSIRTQTESSRTCLTPTAYKKKK